jgi:hypothetical protein
MQAEDIQNHAKMQMFAKLDKAKPVTDIIRGLNMAAVKRTTVLCFRYSVSYLRYGMICCSQPGLTEALYILCAYIMYSSMYYTSMYVFTK